MKYIIYTLVVLRIHIKWKVRRMHRKAQDWLMHVYFQTRLRLIPKKHRMSWLVGQLRNTVAKISLSETASDEMKVAVQDGYLDIALESDGE